ncbi:MAG: lysophospholipase, partial [Caulobacterales bacterium]|nr:lysophospholipase [Caulobacterales bacterium]
MGVTALTAACAPQVQQPLVPPSHFDGPKLEEDALVSFDGARLGLQSWLPGGEPWAVIVAVHGMSEYAEAFYLAGPWFAEQGVAVYAYDQRGFGRSPGRGVWPGAELMARDLETALTLARARHPDAPTAVLGESMGAATVMSTLARAEEPLADRVVLVAPGVRGWSALPVHYKLSLAVAAHVAPRRAVRPPRGVSVQATDNLEALYKNGDDPLFLRDTRFDMLHGLISLMEEASEAP